MPCGLVLPAARANEAAADFERQQGVSGVPVSVDYQDERKFAAAAGNYREAAELQPQNSYFQMNLGNALLKQKLYAEAAAKVPHARPNVQERPASCASVARDHAARWWRSMFPS